MDLRALLAAPDRRSLGDAELRRIAAALEPGTEPAAAGCAPS